MIRGEKWDSIILIVLLGFSNVFCVSGLAHNIYYNEIATFLSPFIFCSVYNKTLRMPVMGRAESVVITLWIAIVTILILIHYQSEASQFRNLVVTFGIVMWVKTFSIIRWELIDSFVLGVTASIVAIGQLYLFLPGHTWSGWNPNSVIGVVPLLFLGVACIWTSNRRRVKRFAILLYFIFVLEVSTLENRSSLLALALFAFIVLTRQCMLKRKWFRWFYMLIIFANVLIPYLNDFISHSSLFQDILGFSSQFISKGQGFNNREELWISAIGENRENPLWGMYGVRPFYAHNLSMDMLMSFGWLGLLVFFVMLVIILEKAFKENSKYNIFLVGFVCLLLVNTFENIFACNDFFTIFAYSLPAVSLAKHYRSCHVML